jgi:predicted DCC family thiol-disulfide oxidoreductase YuxK
MDEPRPALEVFHDGGCPLCRAEVEGLAAAVPAGRWRLVDIASQAVAPPGGFSREAMLAELHVRDAAGAWHIGVPAFAALYADAGFARTARVLASRRLGGVLAWAYPRVVRARPWLVRLGLHRLLRWRLAIEARRAHARAAACAAGACALPQDGSRPTKSA